MGGAGVPAAISLADALIKAIEQNRHAINSFSQVSGFGHVIFHIRHHTWVKVDVAPEIYPQPSGTELVKPLTDSKD